MWDLITLAGLFRDYAEAQLRVPGLSKSLLTGFACGITLVTRGLACGLIRDDARGENGQCGSLSGLFGGLRFLSRYPFGFLGGLPFSIFGGLAGELLQFGGGSLCLSDFSRLANCLSLGLARQHSRIVGGWFVAKFGQSRGNCIRRGNPALCKTFFSEIAQCSLSASFVEEGALTCYLMRCLSTHNPKLGL
jgi:hypothetical protein